MNRSTLPLQNLSEIEAQLASLAGKLLAVCFQAAERGSTDGQREMASRVHAEQKLYPRLTVTSPHAADAIRIELALCDDLTDQAVVQMLVIEGEAQSCKRE